MTSYGMFTKRGDVEVNAAVKRFVKDLAKIAKGREEVGDTEVLDCITQEIRRLVREWDM